MKGVIISVCCLTLGHAFLSPHSPPSRTRIHLLHETNGEAKEPYTIETTYDGPNNGAVHTLTFAAFDSDDDLVVETGRMGRQASGAVTVTRGDSVLYATASHDRDPTPLDFVPLQVEHQERFSSVGTTSGSYTKRDGRPAEHEILTCRLMDRPLRPMVDESWRYETQVLSWVLSYDGVRSCDPLAVLSGAACTWLSAVPLKRPVAAAQVGYINETFVVNPTVTQWKESQLQLTVAGTQDAILMIEGAADFLPESVFLEAIQFGHGYIQTLCKGLEAFKVHVESIDGVKEAPEGPDTALPEGLQDAVDAAYTERVDAMYKNGGSKKEQGLLMNGLYTTITDDFAEQFGPDNKAKIALKDLLRRRMFDVAQETGKRGDGRKLNEIRAIDVTTSMLPRVHGCALFTRGETQALASATLGTSGMKQRVESIDGTDQKRFYLQYTFPPSCVGETGRIGMPGRREVGHGNLAERALIPTLPSEEDFPYAIRVESLITESHGSSSMASVCGGCLALMDAGVPIKHPVAGIAMGMLLGERGTISDENALILSDITGTEDFLGTMDFKVAGSSEGITTFQLDIKCEGLTYETMAKALEQARQGRIHILNEMAKGLDGPKTKLPPTVPKMMTIQVEPETIGKIIGPGGKQIRAVIEDFGLTNMDVNDGGQVQISSFDEDKMKEAAEFVKALVAPASKRERPKYVGPEPVEGAIYTGPIKGIHPFGVFVEILPGAEDGSTPGLEGLVHVSEMARDRVRSCEGFVKSLNVDELTVMYMGLDRGKIKLSRKEALDHAEGKSITSTTTVDGSSEAQPAEMTKEEEGIIAAAIDGLEDL